MACSAEIIRQKVSDSDWPSSFALSTGPFDIVKCVENTARRWSLSGCWQRWRQRRRKQRGRHPYQPKIVLGQRLQRPRICLPIVILRRAAAAPTDPAASTTRLAMVSSSCMECLDWPFEGDDGSLAHSLICPKESLFLTF